ncbi:hypothetical protein [Candidatus Poriferisodalis sp.]|uniref:hypothetical protein n=1 Tax=Candidatus Poriferisodalis sp. TaxID=3101277 RepID=UPI003B02820F
MAAVAVTGDKIDARVFAAEASQPLAFAPPSPVLNLIDLVFRALEENDLDEFFKPAPLLGLVTAGGANAIDDLADRDKRLDRRLGFSIRRGGGGGVPTKGRLNEARSMSSRRIPRVADGVSVISSASAVT